MSRHPVDRLIRELIVTKRSATAQEVQQIIDHIAAAPFNPETVMIRGRYRGTAYQGQVLGTRADSATYHLIKRVVIERQWAYGTVFDDYLEDLRRAVRDPSARLVLYAGRQDHFAATISDTARVLKSEQLGSEPFPLLLVVYSADYAIIKTGYMISAPEQAGIPKGARWLR